ncbi:Hypothetical protein, putative [Bodo saltans]|uniref:Uncharacterized protein n=1 Tax=Bodo saltans TaxID=75058 RepID=A0A0S4J671_BODSA|nr:Hypothetical protein, putative [Bodo saltans]|eukprot:CUG85100.1 Hypothetical protein, putative [Bodo saltans]
MKSQCGACLRRFSVRVSRCAFPYAARNSQTPPTQAAESQSCLKAFESADDVGTEVLVLS